MRKVMQYHLVYSGNFEEFEDLVNNRLDDDMELYGAPFMGATHICQALVKYAIDERTCPEGRTQCQHIFEARKTPAGDCKAVCQFCGFEP